MPLIPMPYVAQDFTNWDTFDVMEDYEFWGRLIAAHKTVDLLLRTWVEFQAEAETELRKRGVL